MKAIFKSITDAIWGFTKSLMGAQTIKGPDVFQCLGSVPSMLSHFRSVLMAPHSYILPYPGRVFVLASPHRKTWYSFFLDWLGSCAGPKPAPLLKLLTSEHKDLEHRLKPRGEWTFAWQAQVSTLLCKWSGF